MTEEPQPTSLRDRFGARGEEALGRIAQDLLENPWVNSALSAALEARGRAAQAQEVAMEFLNIPSAAHIERLTRRVRSVSQRLEAIEDSLTRLEDGAVSYVAVKKCSRNRALSVTRFHEQREMSAKATPSLPARAPASLAA